MDIGKNIARLRKKEALTQEELGARIGVSNQAVSKWECGASMPDIMLLPQIAEALGVDVNSLFADPSESHRITADDFPYTVYKSVMQMFYENDGVRFLNGGTTDDEQLLYRFDSVKRGQYIGCFSESKGAVTLRNDFCYIDCDYGSNESADIFSSMRIAEFLKLLSNSNVLKVLAYEYKQTFAAGNHADRVFSIDEISEGCCLSEAESVSAVLSLVQLKLNEAFNDGDRVEEKYVFKASSAVYALGIFKLCETMTDDKVWCVVSMTLNHILVKCIMLLITDQN